MGTQQILLIVIGVIVVGVSVSVGITMFNNQSAGSNRQAVIQDLNTFAGNALAYYKAPSSFGGGSRSWSNIDKLGIWIGHSFNPDTDSLSNENGEFGLSYSGDDLTIVGIGFEIGNDGTNKVKATIVATGSSGNLDLTVNN